MGRSFGVAMSRAGLSQAQPTAAPGHCAGCREGQPLGTAAAYWITLAGRIAAQGRDVSNQQFSLWPKGTLKRELRATKNRKIRICSPASNSGALRRFAAYSGRKRRRAPFYSWKEKGAIAKMRMAEGGA